MARTKLGYGHIQIMKSECPTKEEAKRLAQNMGHKVVNVKTGYHHNQWEVTVEKSVITNASFKKILDRRATVKKILEEK